MGFRKKLPLAVGVTAVFMLGMLAVASTENPLEGLAVKPDGTPMFLGFIANEIRSGWMASATGYMGSLWERAGGTFRLFVSEYDVAKELSQVDDLLILHPDAILFHPSDSYAIAPGVAKANAQGVPTFAVDVGVIGAPVISFVHINQEDLGATNASYLASIFSPNNPAKVLEIMGGLEQDIAVKRRNGFDTTIAEYDYIQLLQEIDCKWSSEKAMNAVMDALERFPDLNCIYVHSDMMLPGVIQALKLRNRLVPRGQPGHVVICSIDGDAVGLQAVRDGYVDAIAEHNPVLHIAVITNIMLAYLHGYSVPEEVVLTPALITIDNVDAPERWGNLPPGEYDKWPVLEQDFFPLPEELAGGK